MSLGTVEPKPPSFAVKKCLTTADIVIALGKVWRFVQIKSQDQLDLQSAGAASHRVPGGRPSANHCAIV